MNNVKEILLLPKTIHEVQDESFYSLLKKSGYFENYDAITEDVIREELEKYPALIDIWVQMSEDNRSTPS